MTALPTYPDWDSCPDTIKNSAIHEAGHAVVYMALGFEVKSMFFAPNVRAGAVDLSESTTATVTTSVRERYIMGLMAGYQAEASLGPGPGIYPTLEEILRGQGTTAGGAQHDFDKARVVASEPPWPWCQKQARIRLRTLAGHLARLFERSGIGQAIEAIAAMLVTAEPSLLADRSEVGLNGQEAYQLSGEAVLEEFQNHGIAVESSTAVLTQTNGFPADEETRVIVYGLDAGYQASTNALVSLEGNQLTILTVLDQALGALPAGRDAAMEAANWNPAQWSILARHVAQQLNDTGIYPLAVDAPLTLATSDGHRLWETYLRPPFFTAVNEDLLIQNQGTL